MNKREITQILNLNKQFYQFVSKDFSNTRQRPWKGWERLVKEVKERRDVNNERGSFKVLDLGCGNGRFFEFINSKIENISYVGIDINNDLINEAKKKYINKKNDVKFIKKDIFNKVEKINGKYDLVVAFGITHHIPDKDYRTKWFSSLPSLVNNRGFLVLTFWEFADKPGEYLLGWNNKIDTARYCYKYADKEIEDMVLKYKKSGLVRITEYISDNENRYLIFGRI